MQSPSFEIPSIRDTVRVSAPCGILRTVYRIDRPTIFIARGSAAVLYERGRAEVLHGGIERRARECIVRVVIVVVPRVRSSTRRATLSRVPTKKVSRAELSLRPDVPAFFCRPRMYFMLPPVLYREKAPSLASCGKRTRERRHSGDISDPLSRITRLCAGTRGHATQERSPANPEPELCEKYVWYHPERRKASVRSPPPYRNRAIPRSNYYVTTIGNQGRRADPSAR